MEAKQSSSVAKCASEQHEIVDHEARLSLHIKKAKPLILALLNANNHCGSENFYEHCDCGYYDVWEALKGTEWEKDPEIAKEAFQDGEPVQSFQDNCLLYDPECVKAFFDGMKDESRALELWDLLSDEVKLNKSVAFAAVDHGVPFNKLDRSLKQKDALLEALSKGLFHWKLLPDKRKRDATYAIAAAQSKKWLVDKRSKDFRTVLEIVHDKKALWKEWAFKIPEATLWDKSMWHNVPVEFAANRELMLDVIPTCPWGIEYLPSSLQNDFDFLEAVLGKNIKALMDIPERIFSRFPSLLDVRRLKIFAGINLLGREEKLSENVPSNCFQNREFVLKTWLAAGLNLNEKMPKDFWDDEEIILTHAEQYFQQPHHVRDPVLAYKSVSRRLRSDKAFAIRLMKASPSSYRIVLDIWKSLDCLFGDDKTEISLLALFRVRALSKLSEFQTFKLRNNVQKSLRALKTYAVLLHGVKDEWSPLSILDQGQDACIKTNIAMFLGAPVGEKMRWVYHAADVLDLSADTEISLT